MENQLFRKKSLERISSPDELHDYMRVTSPRLWMLLGALVILLVGFIIYASTATMENTAAIQVEVEDFEYTGENGIEHMMFVCGTLPSSQKGLVAPQMKVRLGTEEGSVSFVYEDEEGLRFLIEMENERLNLPAGSYEAELVLESTTPISFLWN